MIVITGAAGFIAANFCKKLNERGINNLILIDDFKQERKHKNWKNLEYFDKIQREDFFYWAEQNVKYIDFIFHLGARTDYFSTDNTIFEALNVEYSKRVWSYATYKRIPLVYATSYLTKDVNHNSLYAKSKYIFDKWLDKQQKKPPFWAGLKFFQVYGKNEEHKEENSSFVFKIYKNCMEKKTVISTEINIIQDYIYVNDVSKVLCYFLNHAPQSGIYEVGTGFSRPMATVVDTINRYVKPEQKQILVQQSKEQHFFYQADLSKLRKNAYKQAFLTLEQGIKSLLK
ncbi:MAG: NAD-dependent epimerase/dehydratase family protein [Bacteroidales bacterium]|jgi:ADP-L-glycero-D-manno-heptose 6-epimerase|nr:NAD-dependent epimerase/dehydratase family protein [Bacteroidales bacterium]